MKTEETAAAVDSVSNGPIVRRNAFARARRIVLLFFLLPILLILIGGGLLLYVFQGQEITSEAIDTRVQSALQDVLGDGFEVSIGGTGLSIISSSALSLNGNQVTVTRKADGRQIAFLDEVEIGLNALSLISGNPRFDKVRVERGRLDVAGLAAQAPQTTRLAENLKTVAGFLNRAEAAFVGGTIRSIELDDITVESAGLMRPEPGPLNITTGRLVLDDTGQMNLTANVKTGISSVNASATWRETAEVGRQLTLGIGGLELGEWFETPQILEENEKGIGLAGTVRIDPRIQYDADGNPTLVTARIQGDGGRLRLGRQSAVDITSAVFNLDLDPENGVITLNRSDVEAGGRRFELEGDITPFDPAAGLQGDVFFSLLASGTVPETDKTQVFDIRGGLDRKSNALSLDQILAKKEAEIITGSLTFLLDDISPALNGTIRSNRVSLPTLYSAWPFHVAPKLKTWAQANLDAGTIENLDLNFEVPKGRFAALAGADVNMERQFLAAEFTASALFSGMSVKTPGELPPLIRSNGEINVAGSEVSVAINDGVLEAGNAGRIDVAQGRLAIGNMFAAGVPAELDARLSGALRALATVADREPLTIAKNLAVNPADLEGSGTVDLKLGFDIDRERGSTDITWNADVELYKAGSKSPVFERKISDANLKIQAENQRVTATGNALVDGFRAELDLVEPINGGDAKIRKQDVTLKVTHKELAKQGIDIGTVVKGSLGVKIASATGDTNRYDIDLTGAEISLPWIAWSKGRGIAARASFVLDQTDGRNTLKDFRFSGEKGRKASGSLVFDKSGLISARLTGVSLHGNDSFNASVSRKSGRYEIATDGKMFDGRALINQIIHEDGLNSGEAGNDVTVTANFGSLVGFDGNVLTNSLVRYRTDGGLLTELTVNGAFNNEPASIEARRNGGTTTFEFFSKDAGAALAMVNIYQKMRGGRLRAGLSRTGNGPFTGDVDIKNFIVSDEERLQSLVFAPVSNKELERASGKLRELDVKRVHFDRLEGFITKSEGYFGVKNGTIRNAQIGLTFDGVLYDQNNRMNVRGTFMPLFSVSRLIGGIPILGEILSGKGGVIGITYQLRGPANDPQMLVNPVSVIAPGIFRQIFQFQP